MAIEGEEEEACVSVSVSVNDGSLPLSSANHHRPPGILVPLVNKRGVDSSSSALMKMKRHKTLSSSYSKENIPPPSKSFFNPNPNPNTNLNPPPPPPSFSIESRLLLSTSSSSSTHHHHNNNIDDTVSDSRFRELMRLCFHEDEDQLTIPQHQPPSPFSCPLCALDISNSDDHSRQLHVNACLDNSDIVSIGVTALGPMQSLKELRERDNITINHENDGSAHTIDATKKMPVNRLITEYFSCPPSDGKKILTSPRQQQSGKVQRSSFQRRIPSKNMVDGKKKDVPSWCCIPGTPFRVDAFQYLQRDCSHWFLTHFHLDHYQGLTRSFAYGKIYCSMITAKLINSKIGIPWDRLHIMPVNQQIKIAGVDVTCFDANHCPGAIIILFSPPNGKAVLHTGDFRFNEEMANKLAFKACHIHTLILDTTYCNPQYNFPKQEVVLQFVIEAIQAESFNPKTLFLIGSYTIGKERLFLEVARVLRKKIYVTAAKRRLLECLELPREDMQWFTMNELESHIHVVPMWTIASFKRLKQLSNQYSERFSLIVAFTPTGWTFGKGKKSAGRRWQQGTIIRYEVPYSEHCSFEELKEFVKFISPANIIPSVNNEDEASSSAMTTLLLS